MFLIIIPWRFSNTYINDCTSNMSHSMAKLTKWSVRPAKTQISLGICPVWSESSLSAWRNLGSLVILSVHSEDTDHHADLSLLADWSLCWFCRPVPWLIFCTIMQRLTISLFVCLICGFTSQSTTMFMSRRSVNLTTLFLGRLPKLLTSTCTKCTSFRP